MGAYTVSDGDCYVSCSSDDSYSDEYTRRQLTRYGYRSAIFTPADINNISGAIVTGLVSGGSSEPVLKGLPGLGTYNQNGVLKPTSTVLNSNNNSMRGLLK